jgi:hypothetical protein
VTTPICEAHSRGVRGNERRDRTVAVPSSLRP